MIRNAKKSNAIKWKWSWRKNEIGIQIDESFTSEFHLGIAYSTGGVSVRSSYARTTQTPAQSRPA